MDTLVIQDAFRPYYNDRLCPFARDQKPAESDRNQRQKPVNQTMDRPTKLGGEMEH